MYGTRAASLSTPSPLSLSRALSLSPLSPSLISLVHYYPFCVISFAVDALHY